MFQSVNYKIQKTYDNEEWVMKAMEEQGFVKDESGVFTLPDDRKITMQISTSLIPKCPDDYSDVTMNLRSDDSFVEDEGWHKASEKYYEFLQINKDKYVLFLELGVGANTPVICSLYTVSTSYKKKRNKQQISSFHKNTGAGTKGYAFWNRERRCA